MREKTTSVSIISKQEALDSKTNLNKQQARLWALFIYGFYLQVLPWIPGLVFHNDLLSGNGNQINPFFIEVSFSCGVYQRKSKETRTHDQLIFQWFDFNSMKVSKIFDKNNTDKNLDIHTVICLDHISGFKDHWVETIPDN